MDLRLDYLDGWLPPPLIARSLRKGRGRAWSLSLRVAHPDRVKSDFGALSFGHSSEATGNLRSEARFSQQAWIVATTGRRQPLSWWLSTVVKPLRYLLAISTEHSIAVETIRLRPWSTKADGEVEVVWENDAQGLDPSDLMTVGAAEAYHRERIRRTDAPAAVHR